MNDGISEQKWVTVLITVLGIRATPDGRYSDIRMCVADDAETQSEKRYCDTI
jgi:hypothetical protein